MRFLISDKLGDIVDAIIQERMFQDKKYGPVVEYPQALPGTERYGRIPTQGPGGHELTGWLLVIRKELREAEEAATGHGKKEKTGRNTVRAELIQIAAVAIAALEQHGLEESK